MKHFLFVTGCPRSGTSAMVQLLSGSDDIVIGMERFGHLVQPKNFSLSPEHFERERFLNVEEGDTFYADFNKFHNFDKNIIKKFDSAKYIGDKRPDLYESYQQLFSQFPHAKLLYIYRDIKEVASSYHGRIERGDNWPANKDFKSAVKEWNRSLYLTREEISKGREIAVVSYQGLFLTQKSIKPISDFLGLEFTPTWARHVENIRLRAQELEKKREIHLGKSQLDYIQEHAKTFLISDLQPSRII